MLDPSEHDRDRRGQLSSKGSTNTEESSRSLRSRLLNWVQVGFIVAFAATALLQIAFGVTALLASNSEALHGSLHLRGLGNDLVSRAAQRMADASHDLPSVFQIVTDYVFTVFNIVLGGIIIWLRPRDRTARFLVIGVLGVAVMFNLQVERTFEIIARTPLEAQLHTAFRVIASLAYLYALILFPDGHLVPRWNRWAKTLLYAPPTIALAIAALISQQLEGPVGNIRLIIFFGLLAPTVAVAAQGYNSRRAPTAEERQQARLLFWALIPALLVGTLVLTLGIRDLVTQELEGRAFVDLPVGVFRIFQPVFALIPIALFLGLIRYRLWNVDRLISRTLVYGSLVALIAGFYVGIVVGIGRLIGAGGNNVLLSVIATALVAFAFEPIKSRLQSLANRLVFGKRSTPYEVLSEFSERMAESYATEVLLGRMARLVSEATGSDTTIVWLRVGEELRPAASWPSASEEPEPRAVDGEDLPTFDEFDRAVAVRHQGELLGALTLKRSSTEPLTLTAEKLLADVASQAGLVLRNERLTAELLQRLEQLRRSRKRLVTAQDEERRRLERNIHDGAQQNLVALKTTMALAQKIAGDHSPQLTKLLEQLVHQTNETIEVVRDLARGIFPKVLEESGLVAALESNARKVPLEVVVTGDVGRQPKEVEAAIYFCCLEALQNATKYAEAHKAIITLHVSDGDVTFRVDDDGRGFDPSSIARGSGLQNMEDRLEALGGWVEVVSAVGSGTRVSGAVPIGVSGDARVTTATP